MIRHRKPPIRSATFSPSLTAIEAPSRATRLGPAVFVAAVFAALAGFVPPAAGEEAVAIPADVAASDVEWLPLLSGESSITEEPAIRIEVETGDYLDLTFELPGLQRSRIDIEGEAFDVLAVSGGGLDGREGEPMVPTFSRLVAIPDRRQARIEKVNVEVDEHAGFHLVPMQPGEPGPFAIDRAAYLGAGYPPVPAATLGDPAIVRDLRVAPLTFHPVRFDPSRGTIEVARRIQVRIRFAGEDLRNAQPRRLAKIPASYDQLYRRLVVNYDGPRDGQAVAPGTYVIICPADTLVVNGLQELVAWRRQKGHQVHLATTAETGTTNTAIRNWLRTAYSLWEDPPEYVVLVGDADEACLMRIPCFSFGGGDTDFPYTQLDGEDLFPEVHVGRISVRGYTQLATYMSKIIGYERTPYMQDTSWFTRGCVVGDPYGSGNTCIQIAQWLKTRLLANGYTEVDTIYSGPFVSRMTAALNRGDTVFMYRGYGGMSGYNAGEVRALTNGRKMPFSSQITCGTNSFSQDLETICEAWIRSGSALDPRGGVGAIGASTSSTHTRYNNCVTYGIWGGVFNEQLYNFGAALNRGRWELYINYYAGDPTQAANFIHWINLIGDPAGEVWTGVPYALTVSHPATAPCGTNLVTVTVARDGLPCEKALVCLDRPAGLSSAAIHETGFTGADGRAELSLESANPGSIVITVTRHNALPYQGTIVVQDESRFVGYSAYQVDDDASGSSTGNGDGIPNPGERLEIPVQVRNYGSEAVAGISAALICEDPYVTILDGEETCPDLAPDATGWTLDDFDLAIDGGAPNAHVVCGTLDLRSGSDSWRSRVEIPLVAAEFRQNAVTLYDFGTAIDPGESGAISVFIANIGGAVADAVSGQLLSHSQWVGVTDAFGSFGTISVGGTSENTVDRFGLSVSPDCYRGHVAEMSLVLSFSSGAHDTVAFALTVGLRSSADPTGPDAYGYYAFDNTDVAYAEAPVFDWVDIDPNYGGPGVSAQINDEVEEHGGSRVWPLPFSFQFYGETFDRVTISSDGWLAMGSTWLTNYNNWTIPGVGAPPYLIAPKWDGLYQVGGDRVYFWNDTAGHRFVVQWCRLRNDATGATENFEAILFDPAVYPTETGDGIILFQYQVFNIGDYYHNYWTTGIENGDQTDGLLYSYFNRYTGGSAVIGQGRAIRFVPVAHVPMGMLAGTVRNAAGGAGIPGAQVTPLGRRALTTQADGLYTGLVPAGTYTVVAAHASFAADTVTGVTVTAEGTTTLDFTLTDICGPTFSGTTVLGNTADPAGPYPVSATVTEHSGIASLSLAYNIAGSGWVAVPLAAQGGDVYGAEIPGAACGSMVRYYLQGVDGLGNESHDPPAAPGETYLFWVVPPAFSDDVEIGEGSWTHAVVLPGYQDQWHRSSARNHTAAGSWSWKFGDAQGGDYIALADGGLESQAFGLDGGEALLTFWHWMDAEVSVSYPGQAYDGGLIELSVDMGPYTQVTPVGGYTHTVRTGAGPGPFAQGTPVFSGTFTWRQETIDLSGISGWVRVRFRFGSDGAVQQEGWYVDDVLVMTPDPGPADVLSAEVSLPVEFALYANVPNPFGAEGNPTIIHFDLPRAARVNLSVLDVSGRLVETLVDGAFPAGRQRVAWDACAGGRRIGSGVYFCVLRADGEPERTQRMLVVR